MKRSLLSMMRSLSRGSRSASPATVGEALGHQRQRFHRAFWCVRLFYGLHLFHLQRAFDHWSAWHHLDHLQGLWPLRPLLWLFGARSTVDLVMVLFAVGVGLALLWPGRRSHRILAFLGLFLYAALDNSFGKIDHGFHAWIYVSAFLIFLPRGSEAELAPFPGRRQHYLLGFAAAQAMFLLCYTLSGFWKIQVAVSQAWVGRGADTGVPSSAFSVDAFAYQIAHRLLQTGEETLFGPWLIDHPGIGFVLLWSGYLLELLALSAVLWPILQRPWGCLIIALHMTSTLTLSVGFLPNVLLALVLLILTPFHPDPHRRRNTS